MFDSIWVQLVTAQAAEQQEQSLSIFRIISETSGVVFGAITVLVLMSLGSWYIIGYKWYYLSRARRQSDEFLDTFWQSKRLDSIYQSVDEFDKAPLGEVFKAGYIELTKLKDSDTDDPEKSMRTRLSGIENVERALRRAMKAEMTHLESLVPYLATVGSTAPFVGLFGTVWGIMVAFVNINAQGSAGLDVVAQPIAEALIVTAIGLATAIPAVVAYNYFTNRIKVLGAEMENFSDDFLNIVKRHFFE
jgi:biopolymer transport protein TolQ